MGISSALYSGVSGLNTDSQAMSVIGNNLANTSTVGFKGARTVFSDLLSSTIYGSGGASQVGRGVGMSKVDNVFSQGTFQSTDSGLDCAIEGSGFFLLKKTGDETTYYSRAGAFRFDENGYLINPEGLRVQGKSFDSNGKLIAGDPSSIQVVSAGLQPANATTTMTLNTNLDASATEILAATAFDYTDTTTFNYSSSTQVFDSLGNQHLVSLYFRKQDTAGGGAANTWDWYWTAPNSASPPVILGQSTVGAAPAGSIAFDMNGILLTGGTGATGAIDWANGSDPAIDVALTFNTTQFNSDSVVISQSQNGFGAGNLTGVTIDNAGAVTAAYSNGVQKKIANLVLGKFNSPNGLELVGSNLFKATSSSGTPRVGLPGSELGKVFTNSLEQSNVDMGAQFVEMITIQRAFQANSKIITTIDDLLNEVITMKR
jgi:flagellar hook protein FlgE